MAKRQKGKTLVTRMASADDYNGHPSRHHWSVALNIGNYEHIYKYAMQVLKDEPSVKYATRRFVALYMHDRTAEGYEYTYETVYRALEGLKE